MICVWLMKYWWVISMVSERELWENRFPSCSPSRCLLEFIHDKYFSLPRLDINIFIVPYTYMKHRGMYIVGGLEVLPLQFHNRIWSTLWCCHSHTSCKHVGKLERLWRTFGEVAKSTKCLDSIRCDPTDSSWACGYYVVKNIMEFSHPWDEDFILCGRLVQFPTIPHRSWEN